MEGLFFHISGTDYLVLDYSLETVIIFKGELISERELIF